MRKGRNARQPRKMKQIYLVFCEGESEEAYIDFLKQNERRLPIKLIRHKTKLDADKIRRQIQAEKIGDGDKIKSFFMYDLDVTGTAEKIKACIGSIKNSYSIASNPSVELWFLLHVQEQKAEISTDNCGEKLKKSSPDWGNYKKGALSERQKQHLWDNRGLASDRARQLPEGENPSSSVYRLIEALEKAII
jgi:hypothetical protein